MKIIYVSDDGKQFDNEDDCYIYESILAHPNLKNVCFYDIDGNEYHADISLDTYDDDSIYQKGEKVVIHNEEELKDFLWISHDAGWCEFYAFINAVGTWVRKEEDNRGNGLWTMEDDK